MSVRQDAILSVLRVRHFEPAAQELADFRHHACHVLILPAGEPAPFHGQPQVHAHVIQVLIRLAQVGQSLAPLAVIRRFQMLAQIECGIQQSPRKGVPVRARKERA